MPSPTCYSLYLTTNRIPENLQVSPVNNSNLANVSWNINWDTLFNNEQSKYKHCRLRIEMITQFKLSFSNWDTYLGYLTCNLASNHMASTGEGTILALLYYTYKTRYAPATRAPSEESQFEINTMNTPGVDIIIPTGNSIFNVKLMNDDAITIFNQHAENYQILLQFELY